MSRPLTIRLLMAVGRRLEVAQQQSRVRRKQGEPGMLTDLRAIVADIERLVEIRTYLRERLDRGK